MKNFFLIVFILQFSLFCFSQSEAKHHYTDEEVIKLTNYISELEKKIITPSSVEPAADDKKQITALLNDASHNYADGDIIKIFKYIKDLEKKGASGNVVASVAAEKKLDTALVNARMRTDQMTYLLVKGAVIFEDSVAHKNYSMVTITVSDKENTQVVGIYTPNSKTGKYIFILNSGVKYVVEAESKGYKMYSMDFSPEYKTESYEMAHEIKLKKE